MTEEEKPFALYCVSMSSGTETLLAVFKDYALLQACAANCAGEVGTYLLARPYLGEIE